MYEKNLHIVPPLNALKAFNAAARFESYSKAAEELNVTHTAISHQIAKLEDWLGSELFKKHGRNVKLTSSGFELSKRTERIFNDLVEITEHFRVHDRKNKLIVGCIPSIASRWLVPNLHDFTMTNPDLEVQVLYADMKDKLLESSYDVLITYIDQNSEEVIETPIMSRETYAVCSPKFLEEHGPFPNPESLLNVDMLHDETKENWVKWLEVAGTPITKELNGTTYQDFNLLVISALAGHGIALCPVGPFRDEIRRGDLIVLFDHVINANRHYNICRRKKVPKQVSIFSTWFEGICKD